MSKLKIFITFLLFICSLLPFAFGNTYDRDYITHFAKEYVRSHLSVPDNGKLTISPSTIDSRITIKPCDVPLTANIPESYSTRNVNVKVSCASSIPWNIYLPVKVVTKIPVIVAKKQISKGSVLDNNNIHLEWRELHKIRGEVIEDIKLIIGSRANRTLSKGAIMTKKSICVVCKGETVTITAKSNNFMIKTAGIALKNASFGEQVSIKNTRSGRTIKAQVKAINQVIINL